MSEEVHAGVYEHWKGSHYLVLGVGRYDPTDEEVVIYVRLYSRDGFPLSVRPRSDFLGKIEDGGMLRPRFRYIGDREI